MILERAPLRTKTCFCLFCSGRSRNLSIGSPVPVRFGCSAIPEVWPTEVYFELHIACYTICSCSVLQLFTGRSTDSPERVFEQPKHSCFKKENHCIFSMSGGNTIFLQIARNTRGCLNSLRKRVKVQEGFNHFVSDAFAHKSDNLNEQFLAVVRDVCYWKIEATSERGINENKVGHLTLLR